MYHEDPRIIANTLEALATYNNPEWTEKFIEFSTSSDNRIRANALMALYQYEPKLVEKHIEEMVKSSNIALQDSAVFLLRKLRPTNLGKLLNIIQHSRFATVRLKSLDIPPPTQKEIDSLITQSKREEEKCDPDRDLIIMYIMIAIGVIMLLIADTGGKTLLSFLFIGVSVLTISMPEHSRPSIQKSSLSIGFISSLTWGSTHLLIIPALLGVWLTLKDCSFTQKKENLEGKSADKTPSILFAWFFSIGAIIISQVIQGNLSYSLIYASKLLPMAKNVPNNLVEVISRQKHFDIVLFAVISLMTLIILKFNQWFPPKDKRTGTIKRMFVAATIFLIIICIMNFAHIAGVKLHFKVTGIGDSIGLIKKLLSLLNPIKLN